MRKAVMTTSLNMATERDASRTARDVPLTHQCSRQTATRRCDLRTIVAELLDNTTAAAEKLKAEKAQLQSELGHTTDERDRLARDLASMKREAEENWASGRLANASLRKRINDVAAEVARLASALEGPNSPIDAILAAETVRNRGKLGTASRNGDPEFGVPSTNGDLADRIRALQSHTSHVPQNDKPTTRD